MKNVYIFLTLIFGVGLLYGASISQNGASGGISGGSNFTMATTNVGVWNMDTTTTTSVNVTGDFTKVRMIDVWISQDDGTIYYNLNTYQGTPQQISGSISDVSDNGDGTFALNMDRLSSGFFDENADFNDGVINRGFITVIFAK